MHRIVVILFIFFVIGNANWGFAQRFGFVETQEVLDKMPEYQSAQKYIENISKKWQEELDNLYKKVEKLYKEYRAKEVLMSAKQKQEFQDKIIKAEEEAREYQKQKFGYNGELFKLRQEKIRPVEEKLFKTIESYAKSKRVDVMYGINSDGSIVILYVNPAYKYTNIILKQLGLSNK